MADSARKNELIEVIKYLQDQMDCMSQQFQALKDQIGVSLLKAGTEIIALRPKF